MSAFQSGSSFTATIGGQFRLGVDGRLIFERLSYVTAPWWYPR